MFKRALIFIFILLFLMSSVRSSKAYYTNMSANTPVLFQPNFNSNSISLGVTSSTVNNSNAIYVATDGTRLVVSDGLNHRLLIWNNIPTTNQQPADIVLGQPDFTSSTANNGGVSAATFNGPRDIYYSEGKLFVIDESNHRVLIWNSIPTSNFQAADVVVGQPDFTTVSGGTTATKMSSPHSLFVHDGKLFVAEVSNNRVIIFNTIPTTNGAAADVVVGQTDFGTSSPGGTTATGFGTVGSTGPRGVMAFENKLFVSDSGGGNRVLIFDPIPTTNGASASLVLGQPGFTSNTADNGGVSCASLNAPHVLRVINNRFFVGDSSRLIIFNQIPTSNFASADLVIGQPDCSQRVVNNGGVTEGSLNGVVRSLLEINNKLIVTDSGNRRVLFFDNVQSGPKLSINQVNSLPGNKINIGGTVSLGERGKYALQKLQANINNTGFFDVTKRDGGRDQGDSETIYDFYHEFEPWVGVGEQNTFSTRDGYSVLFRAQNSNAEEDNLFYFTPFDIVSITNEALPLFTIKVAPKVWDRIKTHIDTLSIRYKKPNTDNWATYIENVPIDETTAYSTEAGTFSVRSQTKSFPGGNFIIQAVGHDNWGHTDSRSNEIKFISSGVSFDSKRPSLLLSKNWFPIQINRIAGVNTGIISSFFTSVKSSYISTTKTPTFYGVAFNNSKISMAVTDLKTGKSTSYKTIASNSIWKLIPTLYKSSVVEIWVEDDIGNYNELPTLVINAP